MLAPGKEGDLLVRGPALFLGYSNLADNVDAFDADGLFRTDDIGVISPDCLLTITGRP